MYAFSEKNGFIDYKRTEKQVITAIENGVNYFDTAYLYSGSEKILGKILANGYRDKVKIADKMKPGVKSRKRMNTIFEEQLERLQTDYIDYYMIHSLVTFEEWEQLKKAGILEFVKTEKNNGRIINFGFSYHGNLLNFKKIIDDYDWEFCMIQYNYIDEQFQAGSEGLEYAASKNIAVIAMEPLRGGMLVNNLPESGQKLIEEFKIKRSPEEWAFRWGWDNPAVTVVLSGMNEETHIEENIQLASDALPNSLTSKEKEMLNKVKDEFKKNIKVECTNCAYCMPCPNGVDIPTCFTAYNEKSMFGGFRTLLMYVHIVGDKSGAYKCNECGVCEKKCPQEIGIIDELKNVSKSMDRWYYRLIVKIWKIFVLR